MNYWIFVVTDQKVKDRMIEAIDLFNNRMRHKFWSFSKKNPRLKRVTKGDKVALFRGGEDGKVFAGTAKLASDPSPPSRELKKYVIDMPETMMREARLEEIQPFDKPKAVADLVDKLTFIMKKERWQAYFQGGLVQISEQDYNTIAGG